MHKTASRTPSASSLRWTSLLVLLSLVSLLLLQWLYWRFANRASEPQLMTWIGPHDATPFGKAPTLVNCRSDKRWQLVFHRNRAWALCQEGLYQTGGKSHFRHGALVRFSLPKRKAHVLWTLPPHLRLESAVGLLPPTQSDRLKDKLALIYRANTAEGPLVVAVTEPTRWQLPPTPLAIAPAHIKSGTPRGRLIGMAWRDPQTLEILWVAGSVDDTQGRRAPIQYWSISLPNKAIKRQTIPRQQLCGTTPCQLLAAYRTKQSKLWQLLGKRRTPTEHKTTPTNAPTLQLARWSGRGTPRWTQAPKAWQKMAFMTRSRIDLTIAGLLPPRPATLAKRLTQDGTLVALPRPPRFEMRLQRQGGQYITQNGQALMRYRWTYRTPPAKPGHDLHKQRTARPQQVVHHLRAANKKKGIYNEGILLERKGYYVPHTHKGERRWRLVDTRLLLKRLDAYEITYRNTIARSPQEACLLPSTAALAPLHTQKYGRYWLLHTSGCHLTLTDRWTRQSQSHITQTYQRYAKRSPWHKRRIQMQMLALAWAFAGLPFCLFLGLLAGPHIRRYQKRRAKDEEQNDHNTNETTTHMPLILYPRLHTLVAITLYLTVAAALWPLLQPFF